MAAKKVYYFKARLYQNNVEHDFLRIKNVLGDIINNNAISFTNYKSLDVSIDLTDPLHTIFDIYEYKNSRLFARISRQKPTGTMIVRDYSTYQPGEILPGQREQDKGIETYTYCMLDYSTGIFAIVSSMGAPSEKTLCSIILKYLDDYLLELDEIPNAHAIDTIYNDDNTEILNLEVEFPVPDVDALITLFKWNDNQATRALLEKNLKAVITVKPQLRGRKLTSDGDESKGIIDCIWENIREYTKARVKAKTRNLKAREYNFFEENFSYTIDISSYHIENGERVYFTADELMGGYRENLIESFNTNRPILTVISGR